nr:DUF4382 domain-containing protein [Haloferax mucosum]
MVALAGCAGGTGSLTDASQSENSTGTTETTATDGRSTEQTGTMKFYVSDERNAIADFEHLNVTIERVTLVRASGGADRDTDADGDAGVDENESAARTAEDDATVNVTGNTSVEVEAEANASNESISVDASVEADVEGETSGDANANESDSADETAETVTYEVDNVTVDLTELQGDNASLVGEYDVPEGNYTKVFVHVGTVNGTLTTGEQVTVKLPSEKLHLNSNFEVERGSSVDFVFDITAFKAGKSGTYILKPVVSESGIDVPITDVAAGEGRLDTDASDERDEDGDVRGDQTNARENGRDNATANATVESESDLVVNFGGEIAPDETATLVATQNGTPVENATVTVNGEVAATTNADGEAVVDIPDTEDVAVVVTRGDTKTELEFEFVVSATERLDTA